MISGLVCFCGCFFLLGLDYGCKAEGQQTEDDSRKDPVQTHVVQGQVLHCRELERAQDARADCAQCRAAGNIVVDLGHDERNDYNDQCGGIDDVQNGGCDSDDAVEAEVCRRCAEYADDDDEGLIGDLAAAQLGEVGCCVARPFSRAAHVVRGFMVEAEG